MNTPNNAPDSYNNDLLKESAKIMNVNRQLFQQNLSSRTQAWLSQFSDMQPKYHIDIDGIDFFIPEKHIIHKLFKNKYYCFYAKMPSGKIELRFVRFSGSGKKWHVFPGLYGNHSYSKTETLGLPYENGVNISEKLLNVLQLMQDAQYVYATDFDIERYYGQQDIATEELKQEFIIEDIFENNKSISFYRASRLINNRTKEVKEKDARMKKQKELFERFLYPGYTQSLRKDIFGKNIAAKEILGTSKKGNIEYFDVVFGEFQGQKVVARIVHDMQKPDLYWVEDIYVHNSPITSLGVPKYRFKAGIFVCKPEEYKIQTPEFIQEDFPNVGETDYINILPYTQENPFIKAFKEFYQVQNIQNATNASIQGVYKNGI